VVAGDWVDGEPGESTEEVLRQLEQGSSAAGMGQRMETMVPLRGRTRMAS